MKPRVIMVYAKWVGEERARERTIMTRDYLTDDMLSYFEAHAESPLAIWSIQESTVFWLYKTKAYDKAHSDKEQKHKEVTI